ncbi:twin-arginine translocation signal domain-containing protein [Halalkalicoccus jeotgali]|uniref:twin-arginine translocation signal domain-containing protein n=1 Tax=Halalkalicoccus jeotgali TaxID=413810 RepID=UPI0009D9BA2D|nr:twin-arginine translocation signal domain-containing protein [Halalkalicoccus jeotgali]
MTSDSNSQQDSTTPQADASAAAPFFTRRRLIKGTAGVAGAGAMVGLGLWYGAQPSLAETFSENENGTVEVVTNDGELTDVSVAPVFEMNWSDFGDGVADFTFTIDAQVGTDGPTETIYDVTGMTDASDATVDSFTSDDLSSYNGTATITCAQQSILGTGITADSFPSAVSDGATETQDVTLTLSASGTTNSGGSASGDPVDATFTVSIENPDSAVTTSLNETNAEVEANNSST